MRVIGRKLFVSSRERSRNIGKELIRALTGDKELPNAIGNVRIKKQTTNEAIKQFSKLYQNKDHEFSFTVDDRGFVHGHTEGEAHSVIPKYGRYNNATVIHNHPSGGAFSGQDLKVWSSSDNVKGVVAVGRNSYTYRVTKTAKFNAKEFQKAMNSIKSKTGDYNKDVHNFLKGNAKKYGYTYSRTKTVTK